MNCYRNHVISKDVISFSHTASCWFTCILNSEKIIYLNCIQLCNQHRFLNSNLKIDTHARQFFGDCLNCSPSHKSSIWSSQTNADFPAFLYHIVLQYFFCFFHCKVTFWNYHIAVDSCRSQLPQAENTQNPFSKLNFHLQNPLR